MTWPNGMTDQQMKEHMADLNDEQLSDVLAALDATPQAATAEDVNHLTWALAYARLNIPVFMLLPGDKRPLIKSAHDKNDPAKGTCTGGCGRYGHGFHDATTDPATIRDWWTANPQANIGTPTGRREQGGCGWDVIDVDRDPKWPDPTIGYRSLTELKHADCPPDCSRETFCPATGALPPVLWRATTPRGGRHIYTAATGSTNTTQIRPGIDLRGDGGYVALPPSLNREHGRRYTWITGPK